MSQNPKERRREKRNSIQGEITLRIEGIAQPQETRAILMDVSEAGFRARHRNLTLTGNQEVRFRMKGFAGTARVVWNRILGEEVETGFVVTERK